MAGANSGMIFCSHLARRENYRTSMDTIERIEELKREIVETKITYRGEEAKIER